MKGYGKPWLLMGTKPPRFWSRLSDSDSVKPNKIQEPLHVDLQVGEEMRAKDAVLLKSVRMNRFGKWYRYTALSMLPWTIAFTAILLLSATVLANSAPTSGGVGGTIRIVSGTGPFMGVSDANNAISVAPGSQLSGQINLSCQNIEPGGDVAPLIYTPSWGDPMSSYRTITFLPMYTCTTIQTANVSLTAPVVPGVYHIIFAFAWQMNGGQVASGTGWGAGGDLWGDGNDIAKLSQAKISQGQRLGYTTNEWVNSPVPNSPRSKGYVPLDAITVFVQGIAGLAANTRAVVPTGLQNAAPANAALVQAAFAAQQPMLGTAVSAWVTIWSVFMMIFWAMWIGSIAVSVLVCWLLYKCLDAIPPPFRKQEPGLAFLLLIPLFNIVWIFFVFLPLARGYQAYFASRGRTDVGDCGYGVSKSMCIWTVVSLIPLINLITGIVAFILFIMAMVKAWHFKGLIEADRAVSEGVSGVPMSNFAMATASVAAQRQSPPPPPIHQTFTTVGGPSKPPPPPPPLSRREPPPTPLRPSGGPQVPPPPPPPPPQRLAGMPPPPQDTAPMAFTRPPAAIREGTVRPSTPRVAVMPPPLVSRGSASAPAPTSEFRAGSGTSVFSPAPAEPSGGLRWVSPGTTSGQPLPALVTTAVNVGVGRQGVLASGSATRATHGIVSKKRVTTMIIIAAIIALSAVLPWAVVSESVIGIKTTTMVMGFYFWQAGVCTALGVLIVACTIMLLANGGTTATVVKTLKWAVLSGFILATLAAILGIFLPASARYTLPPQYTAAMRSERQYENMFPPAVQARLNATINAYSPRLSIVPIAPVGVAVLAAAGIFVAAVECRSAG